MLHITNGSSVSIAEAGMGGEVLPWNDPLHEGPVPDRLSLAELSALRAEFLAGVFEDDATAFRQDFERRDNILRSWRDHGEIVLWFEHDLYDQLQLLQLLDFFAHQEKAVGRVKLVQSDTYLGPMSPGELAALFPRRQTVTTDQMAAAVQSWAAFRSPEPVALVGYGPRPELPFMASAFRRHLDEFPSRFHGLGRTQKQIVEIALEHGPIQWREAFRKSQAMEEAVYLGDSLFEVFTMQLAAGAEPPVRFDGETITATEFGRSLLNRRADHVERNGIDRWLGGVHLTPDNLWRW